MSFTKVVQGRTISVQVRANGKQTEGKKGDLGPEEGKLEEDQDERD
jgi:hypothetical protein